MTTWHAQTVAVTRRGGCTLARSRPISSEISTWIHRSGTHILAEHLARARAYPSGNRIHWLTLGHLKALPSMEGVRSADPFELFEAPVASESDVERAITAAAARPAA